MSKEKGARGKPPAHSARKARAKPPESAARERPVFCFRHAQINCDPRWAFRPLGPDAAELMEFLRLMAQSTWAEIENMRTGGQNRHKKHHDLEVDAPPFDPQAVKDLEKAKLGQKFGETMFRFRLSGEKRLWGFRNHEIFHVVWWDPEHKVCPSEKGHT
jgi:hypothetical protein